MGEGSDAAAQMQMNRTDDCDLKIEVIPAALEQKPTVGNLLELYMHDFSGFVDLEIEADGRFGYKNLDLYWTDPHRLPFLIYVNRKLAGFALVAGFHKDTAGAWVWDMAEFFILRGYRRRGIGAEAAEQVWRRFPGCWEVRVRALNEPAYRFWRRALASFSKVVRETRFEQGGRGWHRFSFESKQESGRANEETD